MGDVFEVFASDIHTAKVPSLGLIDFVRWQTVIDKWPAQPTLPPDVAATIADALVQRKHDLSDRPDLIERYDAALTWLAAQEATK